MSKRPSTGNSIRDVQQPAISYEDKGETKLLWTKFLYDDDHAGDIIDTEVCPSLEDFNNKKLAFGRKPEILLYSPTFWQMFCHSEEVYLIDDYFTTRCYDVMEHFLKKKQGMHDVGQKSMTITIVSCWDNKEERDLISSYAKECFQSDSFRVNLYQYKKPYGKNDIFHDRFALMDDKIWHCGSTIGGVYGNGITAMSGAWNDIDGGFKNLVSDVINRCCEEVK